MTDKNIIIAVSGGVDSSVTAALLNKDKKNKCYGATMSVWNTDGPKTQETLSDARKVCNDIHIPFYIAPLEKCFKKEIIDNYFIHEYINGRTPNPCVVCNHKVKFGLFYDMTKEHFKLDSAIFATGHYVRIKHKNNRAYLYKGLDKSKDQSYMLWMLNQQQLMRTITPLGEYSKDDIRDMARELGLHVSEKKDSQDACFIDKSYHEFLKNNHNGDVKTGDFIDLSGNILGKHKGIPFYTIGQRKGLGIASKKPLYVKKINSETNNITLCHSDDLIDNKFIVSNINWIAFDNLNDKLQCKVRIRYNSKEVTATVVPIDNEKVLVEFKEAQSAVTTGQSAVFYDDNMVLGGGIIDSTEE